MGLPDDASASGSPPVSGSGTSIGVLADRLAAALRQHEPGWRLPRQTTLARRYSVAQHDIDAAIDELVHRHLLRRLADGHVYRASPVEQLINLTGVAGLRLFADPMGARVDCRSRHESWRQPPEDVAAALGLAEAARARVLRVLWTVGGEPAAFATTFLPSEVTDEQAADGPAAVQQRCARPVLAGLFNAAEPGGPGGPADGPLATATGQDVRGGSPAALHIEMGQPSPAVARSLRISAGQLVTLVTLRFDEATRPVALSLAVLRPDLFRLVVHTEPAPLPEAALSERALLAMAWTDAAQP